MSRPRFNRILLKLSGEAMMGSSQLGIDPEAVDALAREVIAAREQCPQLCLVVGGGNIFRGMAAAAKGFDRASADYMGMLATVMNAIALQGSLEKQGAETRVQSAEGIEKKESDFAAEVAAAAGTGKPEPVA